MSYIGLPPKANFTSGLLDRFTGLTTNTVTLTHDIASENDIVVFVNFVKQDSTTYSVGGTGNKTLTLGGTLVSSDIVEVHYLNIVGQTVNPSANSVGSSQLTADSITGQTAETSIATDDTVLIHDTSAGALRKMTRANFVSGIGGNMSPMFSVTLSGNQTVSDATTTKVNFNSEDYDADGVFDATTNYRFTPTTAGKYLILSKVMVYDSNGRLYNNASYLRKNGSTIAEATFDLRLSSGYGYLADLNIIKVISMNGSSDYLEMFAYIDGTGTLQYQASNSYFQGYKIIE